MVILLFEHIKCSTKLGKSSSCVIQLWSQFKYFIVYGIIFNLSNWLFIQINLFRLCGRLSKWLISYWEQFKYSKLLGSPFILEKLFKEISIYFSLGTWLKFILFILVLVNNKYSKLYGNKPIHMRKN